jgi:succinate dehydrogenase (ubiquinone) flavoprotein subunit
VPGLYAAGEAACVSVHGANRLGANSLLDIVVFGRACANHIKENLEKGKPHAQIEARAGHDSIEALDALRRSDGPKHTSEIRLKMQKAMQVDAAVFRTQESLDNGVKEMTEINSSFKDIGIKDRSMIWNSDLVEALERACRACPSRAVLTGVGSPQSADERVPDGRVGRCEEG